MKRSEDKYKLGDTVKYYDQNKLICRGYFLSIEASAMMSNGLDRISRMFDNITGNEHTDFEIKMYLCKQILIEKRKFFI